MQIYEYIFFKLSKIEGGRSPPRKIRGGGGGDTSPHPPGIAAYVGLNKRSLVTQLNE